MINHWQGLLEIAGGIVWFIGALINLNDLDDNGKSLKEFRGKFGHDLGMLLFCLHVGLVIVAWPPYLGVSFAIGVFKDVLRLFRKPAPETTPVDMEKTA